MAEILEEDVGRKVLYKHRHGPIEEGVITSMNSSYVFVRFGNDTTSKACNRSNLELMSK